MATKKTTHTSGQPKSVQEWIDLLEKWFTILPGLPKEGRDAVVSITPWFALVFGVLSIIRGINSLGFLFSFSPFIMGGGIGNGVLAIHVVLLIVSGILLLLGFPGSKAHTRRGWKMIFWSVVVSTFSAMILLSFGEIMLSVIGLYLLFQVKSYYT